MFKEETNNYDEVMSHVCRVTLPSTIDTGYCVPVGRVDR